MKLIVGLGNPGKKYQKTPHNLGFWIVDEIQKRKSFSNWKKDKKGNCFYTKGLVGCQEVKLIKPLTWMNNSGQAVKYIAQKNNIDTKNILIIHDDIDLPLGKIKLSFGRGSAGHKGVESIIKELGTKNFFRLRIGICPKEDKPKNLEQFVLQKFNKKEEEIVKKTIIKIVKTIEDFLK